MIFEKEVEVVLVSRATESATGDLIYQVTFGERVNIDGELRKSLQQLQNSKPPKEILPTILNVFISSDGPLPYRIGSRWRIEITDNGSITVKEAR